MEANNMNPDQTFLLEPDLDPYCLQYLLLTRGADDKSFDWWEKTCTQVFIFSGFQLNMNKHLFFLALGCFFLYHSDFK